MPTRMPIASDQANSIDEKDQITPREAASIEKARIAELLLQECFAEASKIQLEMLPPEPLRLPFVEICHRFRSARIVSGDFLDYFPLGPHNIVGLYVGDIMGKGIAAALYGAQALSMLRAIHKQGASPAAVIECLNHRLGNGYVTNRFCVVQYAVLDGTSGELSFVNAGNNPRPIHITASGCRKLGEGGFPCGMFREATYDVYTVQLSAGDTVLFSTDGLIEAEDQAGEPFGIERLFAACEKNRHESAEVLLLRLFQAVDAFSTTDIPHDDMTAVTLRVLRQACMKPRA